MAERRVLSQLDVLHRGSRLPRPNDEPRSSIRHANHHEYNNHQQRFQHSPRKSSNFLSANEAYQPFPEHMSGTEQYHAPTEDSRYYHADNHMHDTLARNAYARSPVLSDHYNSQDDGFPIHSVFDPYMAATPSRRIATPVDPINHPYHEHQRQTYPFGQFSLSSLQEMQELEEMKRVDDLRDIPVHRSQTNNKRTKTIDGVADHHKLKGKEHGSMPVVQGISLISTHQLPDRFRTIFPFPIFNAVQSKSFNIVFGTSDNFVLSSPTGSGKTAVLELAICRLINTHASGTYKVIYQAPTKSLCSERQRDWHSKFGPLDMQVAELTGDTESSQLHNVQNATIIVTTPEKWDSITRKWKDHQKLMKMVKLFLMDEVHVLKEDRGATLEAVVSRMKSIDSDVRFVALSATIPNLQDIGSWLGKNSKAPDTPASVERFGEEFRPVKIEKHVCGYSGTSNDFAFDKTLNGKLPDVITKWSQRKPIMIFCFIRSSCVETAKFMSSWWSSKKPNERCWSGPRRKITVENRDLQEIISSGVAFHHAGLAATDRAAVEAAYLQGEINVICCTSTLAMGVNLPCHMVIIKNTVVYQGSGAGALKEYSDLEIIQMLGRAGRPQFDDSAVSVIMTRSDRVQTYEKIASGKEVIESCLHRNLIDHLNAEIDLGTITSAASAKRWLSGTFLYVRLKQNPEHYQIGSTTDVGSLDERLEHICKKGIENLKDHDLVLASPKLHCTEFGTAMAKYYIQFATMKIFLALPKQSKVSEILSAISQAAEFKEIRFRAGEKPAYKDLNKNSSIKFPIPVNLDAPAHKVSLIIQSVLGAVDLPTTGDDQRSRQEYKTAKISIFQQVSRLIRCIVDCQLHLDDAVSARNALLLARSFTSEVWDDSPLHMRQLEGIGLAFVRKLAVAGIKSIEDIENAEQHQIEMAVSRNPPFGATLQGKAKLFPRLRISLKAISEPKVKKNEYVAINVKADIGFLNEKVPITFNKRPVYICFLAELSDGQLVHFARIGARKLDRGQDILFTAKLTNPNQVIRAYVMSEELAGTARSALLKHNVPHDSFPSQIKSKEDPTSHSKTTNTIHEDEFDDFGIDDDDLANAENQGFHDIDELDGGSTTQPPKPRPNRPAAIERTPRQLPNGKWACSHTCKDKSACKHLCCRNGLDKMPKKTKPKEQKKDGSTGGQRQTQLNVPVSKKTAAVNKSDDTKFDGSKSQSSALDVRKDGPVRHRKEISALPIRKRLGEDDQPAPRKKLKQNGAPLEMGSQFATRPSNGNQVPSDDCDDLPDIDNVVNTQRSPDANHFQEDVLDLTNDHDIWTDSVNFVSSGDEIGQESTALHDHDIWTDSVNFVSSGDEIGQESTALHEPMQYNVNDSLSSPSKLPREHFPDENQDHDDLPQEDHQGGNAGSDGLEDWFRETFGTEQFNFIH